MSRRALLTGAAAAALLLPSVAAFALGWPPVNYPIDLGLDRITQNYRKVLRPQVGDNAAYLQAAFDNSATTPVWLTCGDYSVRSAVTVPADGTVVAPQWFTYYDVDPQNPYSRKNCARIIADNTDGNFTATGTAVVKLSDYSTMTGVAVEGTNVAGQADAIRIMGSFVRLEHSTARKANRGVYCNASEDGATVHQGLQIRSNLIGDNQAQGLVLGGGCADSHANSNLIYGNGGNGAELEAAKIQFIDNTVEWSQEGILIFNARGVLVAGNQIYHNFKSGVTISGSGAAQGTDDITLTGNIFNFNGRDQLAGYDCHVRLAGEIVGLRMAGNVYSIKHTPITPPNDPAPNYAFCGQTTATLVESQIDDRPPAQAIGVYQDAFLKHLVESAQTSMLAPHMPQGRLTLLSQTPVMVGNPVQHTSIFYDAYLGNRVPIFDGTVDRSIALPSSGQLVLALDPLKVLAGNIYDVFVVDDTANQVLKLCYGPAWASTSSRGTGAGTTEIDRIARGYWTNANALAHCYGGSLGTDDFAPAANQATYLGSFYATANGETDMNLGAASGAGGGNPILGLFNAYNRVVMRAKSRDTTVSWGNTASNTWEPLNNSTSNRVRILDGLGESLIEASLLGREQTSVAADEAQIGMVLNSTSATPSGSVSSTGTDKTNAAVQDSFAPALGLNYVQAMQLCKTGGTCTYYGSGLQALRAGASM